MNMKNKRATLDKRVQLVRKICQIAFLILLFTGYYMNLRMVIMVLFPLSLIFGNFFCGWVCPYGTLQEVMSIIGRKVFKKRYKMPRKVQKYLQYTRYVLFVIFALGILDTVITLLNGYKSFMGMYMNGVMNVASASTLSIMVGYLIISMIFERPFCNYLCVESAKYGILSLARVFTITRNEDTCVSCKRCDMACPMNIDVSTAKQVRNGQCINCFKCIHVCPIKDTLRYEKAWWKRKK